MTDMEKAENIIISYPQGNGLYSNILAKDVLNACELKSIAQALSQARSEGYRQGRESMREECAKYVETTPVYTLIDGKEFGPSRLLHLGMAAEIRSIQIDNNPTRIVGTYR